ncbi:MAG: FAD-binding oxidoreductase [Fimbriimonadaceae bacterium]|nr:FAD-binding oxidoreductase [Fimbriimonadaceae bacterium]
MAASGDGYAFRPTNVDEINEAFGAARETGRKVVLRGAGRSYGDAALGDEAVVLDLSRMDRILDWNPESGVLEAEGGATLAAIWRHCIEDGWWLPVVSGTMFPTLAGALAMNIHGKNHFKAGSLGEHVLEMEIVAPSGMTQVLHPEDDLFSVVISSAGLLGVITRVRLQMHRVGSGDLRVLPISCRNWAEQFAAFDALVGDIQALNPNCPDYMVSWIDAYAKGANAGRGLIHAAWYTEERGEPVSLRLGHQELPDTILGFIPKSVMWRFLKPWTNRFGMRMINAAKYRSSKMLGDGKPICQSLAGFSFLLDYVPNWKNAYLPHGFIQYQSFVPREASQEVFARQLDCAREAKLEPMLAVLKRHRPDPFLLTWALDGYSLALDFKVTGKNWRKLQDLCWRMNDLVLQAGGRFYFAKDSTLRPQDVHAYLGKDAIEKFRAAKRDLDPEGLLSSSLAERVGLSEKP